MKNTIQWLWFIALFIVLATLVNFWIIWGSPVIHTDWKYQVYQDNIKFVSALAFDEQGHLYTNHERKRNQGSLIKIQQNTRSILQSNINKPDGLLYFNHTLYASSESANAPIMVFKQDQLQTTIAGVNNVEGISLGQHQQLLAIEDHHTQGRLLQINPITHQITVLLTHLEEAEGVCQAPNGIIYFTEKRKGMLEQLKDGQRSLVLNHLKSPSFINCLHNGALLISEERTNFGRLLYYEAGRLTVIASRLRAPQEVKLYKGALYLAEQNRHRILKFELKNKNHD